MSQSMSEPHSSFLAAMRKAVEQDGRFLALLAGGSYAHGGFDAYSDLDFVLVVNASNYIEVMASRTEFAASLGELVSAFTGEHVGESRLLICLYKQALLHVDIKFVVESDLDHQVELPIILYARYPEDIQARLDGAVIYWPNKPPEWFEDRAWIWLHYAAVKYGRGELFEAIGTLSFFREQVLGPMLHRRANLPQRGVRRIEALGLDEDNKFIATVASNNGQSVKNGILAAIDSYLQLRGDAPPNRCAPSMPSALIDLLEVDQKVFR
jgi:predicted nucleotidyltransferase